VLNVNYHLDYNLYIFKCFYLFILKWIIMYIIYQKYIVIGRVEEVNKTNLKTIEFSHLTMFIKLKFKLKID